MARVLLDSVSHCTFMTEKLAKELKLQSEHKELLSVSTFGNKNPKDVDTYVANVVRKITGSIQRGPLQSSDLDFLLSVSPGKIADTVPRTLESVNIDLLIGSDYFWNILGTEKITLPSGLYLVSSKIRRLYPYRKIYRSRSCRVKCFDLFCDITSKLLGFLNEFVFF